MKQHWYLIASLPSLRLGDKPVMDCTAFRAACDGWVSDAELDILDAVYENRQPPAGAASSWWDGEVQLRDAVVRVRAKLCSADASKFIKPHAGFSAAIEKSVVDAFSRANPLEREQELDRIRWSLVEDAAVMDAFGFPALLAYAVKLRIAERWSVLDDETGRGAVEGLIEQMTSLENEQEIES